MAAGDVEDLQPAAEIVPVGDEIVAGRDHDPHVAEERPLHRLLVVRADEQSDVDLVAQLQSPQVLARERLPEAGHRHGVGAVAAGELDDLRRAHARPHLFRHRPRRAPELERRQAVSVHGHAGVGGVRLESRAHDPARLAVRMRALADQLRCGGEDEIAAQPSPDEVELVAVVPHVGAGAAEGVLLAHGVVGGGAGAARRADVRLALEDAHRRPGGQDGRRRAPHQGSHEQRGGDRHGGLPARTSRHWTSRHRASRYGR